MKVMMNALSAALDRVGRLPAPGPPLIEPGGKRPGVLYCYDDDGYVDCPYDDYQDYNDSTTEDD